MAYCYPQIAAEWNYLKNSKTPEDYCPKSAQKVFWICPDCNCEYVSTISSRTIGKTGCPKCKNSKGEKTIREYLITNHIAFIDERWFSDCRYVNPLPFDFYIPSKKMCIEYQGKQHFEHAFGQGEENLASTKRNDLIKRNYCKANGIALVEISYLDFKKIKEILDEIFK